MKCARCGSELPEKRLAACPVCLLREDDEAKPRVLGSLELLEEIGRGGMGTVWRARHRGLDRLVAVKLLPGHLAQQPEFRARFEREAKALALLDHPHIVRVHDYGHEEDASFIVLELVAGKTLAQTLPVSVDRALEIASELLVALAYAHARGVVHRDVKPQNILLDATGRVKVTDFGIARIVHGTETDWKVTASNVAVGTPGYLAPEVLQGAPPDPRRDIYAAGVVLHEMATGRMPIGSFEPAPAPLEPIVRRALAADPSQRYGSADAMRADVDAARKGLASRSPDRSTDELPPEELAWMRSVALLHAISAAVGFWALLQCLTPRKTPDVPPLVMGAAIPWNGEWISYARFEVGAVLAAIATFVPGLVAYALLRRHWRLARLERREPDRPTGAARSVLACGLVAIFVYGVRLVLERTDHRWLAETYIPVIGAPIEFAGLFFLALTILEALRTGRPLRREWRAWLGFAIQLVPPVTHWATYIADWKPT